MPVRVRKFVGGFGLILFVCAYAVAVVWIGERLPEIWWVKMIYFGVAGISWGLPILPLLTWMNGHGEAE